MMAAWEARICNVKKEMFSDFIFLSLVHKSIWHNFPGMLLDYKNINVGGKK